MEGEPSGGDAVAARDGSGNAQLLARRDTRPHLRDVPAWPVAGYPTRSSKACQQHPPAAWERLLALRRHVFRTTKRHFLVLPSAATVSAATRFILLGGCALPAASQFRLGTEQRQPPTGSGDWFVDNSTGFSRAFHRAWRAVTLGWMSNVGPDGVRGMYPSGVGHAVPFGSDQALCGRSGLHIWDGAFNPSSRVTTPCPECIARGASG